MILAYRTQNGKDDTAIKEIQSNPNIEDIIFSVWRDNKIKGYIFIETNSQENCYELLRSNRYLKGLVRGNVFSEELLKNIVNDIDNFAIEDEIIIRQGALKGEVGKIEEIRKDKIKVMLKSSSILIPVLLNKEDIELVNNKEKPKIIINEDFVSKKESGSKEKTECPHCKGELEYLYIQSKRMKEVFHGTGNSICNGEKRDILIGDIMCPKCDKNLTLFWRNKFPGTMIKK